MKDRPNKDAYITRLNKIEGQVKGLNKMMVEDASCESMLVQILATQGALKQIGKLLLKDHMTHCVREGIENGDMEVLSQFSTLLDKFL